MAIKWVVEVTVTEEKWTNFWSSVASFVEGMEGLLAEVEKQSLTCNPANWVYDTYTVIGYNRIYRRYRKRDDTWLK